MSGARGRRRAWRVLPDVALDPRRLREAPGAAQRRVPFVYLPRSAYAVRRLCRDLALVWLGAGDQAALRPRRRRRGEPETGGDSLDCHCRGLYHVLRLAVDPRWPGRWYAAVAASDYHAPLALRPGGFVTACGGPLAPARGALAAGDCAPALDAERVRRAPLLAVMALSFREALIVGILSHLADIRAYVLRADGTFVALQHANALTLIWLLYIPVMLMVLRRPNVDTMTGHSRRSIGIRRVPILGDLQPSQFMRRIREFVAADSGIAVTEYGLLVALVAVLMIGVVTVFASSIKSWFAARTGSITTV